MKNIIMLKRKIVLVVVVMFLIAFAGTAVAQSKKVVPRGVRAKIVGKGKPFADKISLRWNVDIYQLFSNLYEGGVLIDRLIIGKDNKAEPGGWKRITKDTIRALPMQAFNTPDLKMDTPKMIIAQTLYGKPKYPKDISLYDQIKVQDQYRQNRHLIVSLYSALSANAAASAGLAFDDKIVPDTAKKYVYRIYPAKFLPGVGTIDTGFVFVAGHDLLAKETYEGLKTEGNEGYVLLKWNKERSPFSGYFIERSEDKVHYKRLNKSVFLPQADTTAGNVNYTYSDSVGNYKKYYYRLIGVNAFGEYKMFKDVAMGMGVDLTAPRSPLLKFKRVKDDITFSWTANTDKDLKGYFLLQGKGLTASDTIANKQMLAVSATQYQLKLPAKFQSAYYRLLLADTSGNVSFSNPVYIFNPDSIPPAPPVGLAGSIDLKGNVTVKWNMDKTEDALRGYKVFIANQADHDFTATSNIVPDTTYTFGTTLKTLSKYLYVKVAAVDANFNHSKLSKVLRITRPDTIPPPRPVLLGYTNDVRGIGIKWSQERGEDFSHYLVYRRIAGDTLWQNINKTKLTAYTDSAIVKGNAYEYAISAVDSANLHSAYSFPLHIKTAASHEGLNLAFTGNYDSAKKMLNFNWRKPQQQVKFYILYKDQGRGLAMYKSIPATESVFSEPGSSTAAGKYGLKVIYADLTESDIVVSK
jgi:hypothetical protein